MSVKLYQSFGFEPVGHVKSDPALESMGVEIGLYVHTCMLREPRGIDVWATQTLKGWHNHDRYLDYL